MSLKIVSRQSAVMQRRGKGRNTKYNDAEYELLDDSAQGKVRQQQDDGKDGEWIEVPIKHPKRRKSTQASLSCQESIPPCLLQLLFTLYGQVPVHLL